jgi:hypothetical protein
MRRVRIPRSVTRALLAACAALVGLACDDGSSLWDPAASSADPPNIVIYLVDTLRADAVGAYGNASAHTPAVDALARDGVVFEDAQAPSSWTRPSVASLLTGLHPRRHRTESRLDALPAEVSTLAERLAAQGYNTAFITTNPNVGSFFGFDRGFAEIIELYERRGFGLVRGRELITRSDDVNDRAIAWLRQASRPFLLVVHTIDPHKPYAPPEQFDVHGGDYDGPVDSRGRWNKKGPLDSADQARIRSLYRAEVAFNDDSFGHLVGALRAQGRLDDTAIFFTADHGEEFWEQGFNGHGKSLRDTVTRVPLIVRLPRGYAAGRRIRRPVELVDVAATVIELAGLDVPAELDGRSLLDAPRPGFPRIQLSSLKLDGLDLRAARAYPFKLVRDVTAGSEVMHDLREDERALDDAELARRGAMRRELARVLDRAEAERSQRSAATQAAPGEMPEDVESALRALGYIEDHEDAARGEP